MSAIVGIVHVDGAPLDPSVPARMLQRLAHRAPDGRNVWLGSDAGFGHGMLRTTPESLAEAQPLVGKDGVVVLVADARIDNREELAAALGLPVSSALADSALILAAWLEWGGDCAVKLIGDFAFAVWDSARRELFCARDSMGVRSFYYFCDEHVFGFATEIKALAEITGIAFELDEQRIVDHAIYAFEDSERTAFRGIRRLPAAHTLTLSGGRPRLRRYWQWDPEYELALGSDGEYEDAFRAAFTEAVRCRLRSAFPIGSTLSGGLDSSSVACMARQLLRREQGTSVLHTFSGIFPGMSEKDLRRIDERRYVAAVVGGGGVVAHDVVADALDPLGRLDEVLWYLDDPGVPFNLYLHLAIYDTARRNAVRVVLDGLDGDTAVSHGYARLAELAKDLRLFSLFKEARAVARRAPGAAWTTRQVLRTYAVGPLLPRAVKRLRPVRPKAHDEEIACERLLMPDFAKRWRIAERLRASADASHAFRSCRASHVEGVESPLFPYVLEIADKAAAAHGVEPRYPFFDRRLLELCIALPASQKLRDGWSRSILRRAMQGVLPPEIQWRNSKANLSPNFMRGMGVAARATVERLAAEHAGSRAAGVLDFNEVARLGRRYSEQPSMPDAMRLFTALTLAAWLGTMGRASGRNVPSSAPPTMPNGV